MHKDDKQWITSQLKKLPTPLLRQQTLQKYRDAFKQAYDAEPMPHRKEGKARYHANNRLRRYVEKVINLK
jgi:hypothetical protein